MLFNSFRFLLFFPLCTALYFVLPQKIRRHWLLISSYAFYMGWDARYALLLLFVTALTFFAARLVERKRSTAVFAVSVCAVLALLFWFKYMGWLLALLSALCRRLDLALPVPKVSIVLPVGISFFSFQAIGYLADVWRGTVPAERSFVTYALFVSFFPQLVAGPIERSGSLLSQLREPVPFSFDRLKRGMLVMLYGYFLKVVVADRAAILVDHVFANQSATGVQVALATVVFAFQIYGDFAGYSLIACGAAEVLGIRLMRNFDCPYFARSVQDFWRRWHISLSTWFRDYVYIPLGGNRKGRLRKNVNVMAVMLLSGIWHGAGLSFVAWGLLHGAAQVFDDLTKRIRRNIPAVVQVAVTFCYTCLCWLFFRASSLTEAVRRLSLMASGFALRTLWGNWEASYGMGSKELKVLAASVAVFLLCDLCRLRGVSLMKTFLSLRWYVQDMLLAVAVCAILVLGVWGPSYDATQFIYFQF